MDGLLVSNGFLKTEKFTNHYKWLSDAAKRYDISLIQCFNSDFCVSNIKKDMEELEKQLSAYSFIIYWDKDIRTGRYIETICKKIHLPMYNNIDAIALCDDKSETDRILRDSDISIIPTVTAPFTYANIGYDEIMGFLDNIIDKLGVPMIIKESFGSFGAQVYMAENANEVRSITKNKDNVPLIFQKYISKSKGHDVRLQVVGDNVVAAIHRYSINGDFRANLSNGGKMEIYHPTHEECEIAVAATKALGLDFAGVDMLFSKGMKYPADVICEVNSNAHFENISTCTGVNVADKIMQYISDNIKQSNNCSKK